MKRTSLAIAAALAVTAGAASAQEAYIGEIKLVGYTFCPRGTTEANGQLLAISQYSALFSLYGTTYGGDGRTTFALPDLRGRAPIHLGQGAGLSNYPLGARGGAETRTLTTQELPPHNHGVSAQLHGSSADAASGSPAGNLSASTGRTANYASGSAVAMASDAITVTENTVGQGQPVDIRQPYLALRYCVVLQGIFPSRN